MKKQFALDIREVIEREMSDDGLFQIGRKVTKEEGQQLIVNDVNFVVVKNFIITILILLEKKNIPHIKKIRVDIAKLLKEFIIEQKKVMGEFNKNEFRHQLCRLIIESTQLIVDDYNKERENG